eukprot:TRINITY_DN299_c0_g1_i2.p1 TRINITY_DN299_c0_g1~~TRINITY_DN299_c0_g1_i2.p1  ORF type:complete len:220 (-),score=25.53 TRINITY_DN299_c0_g1_i2:36-695(-)
MEGERMGTWEDLRREARKVEHSLDMKLASYSKTADDDSATKLLEIEHLLQQLADINRALVNSQLRTDTHAHALARHHSILEDFSREFRRIRSSLSTSRERAELVGAFHSVREEDAASLGPASRGGQETALLREHGAIYGNVAQIDEVLGQAQETSNALSAQRSLFLGISGKVNNLGAHTFPAVNKLISDIRKRKSKDTLILSTTISICTLLLILYWLSK